MINKFRFGPTWKISPSPLSSSLYSTFKTLLANGFSIFFIKGKPVFSHSPRGLPKNPLGCPILCNWIFGNFILAEEPFGKSLPSFETCILVNNNLCGKLFSSLESLKVFRESFKITSVPLFIPDFTILSYELDNSTLKVLHWVILYCYYIKVK